MPRLTVKDIQKLRGERQIAFVQVARAEEAIAASEAGMDMIGTAFQPERQYFLSLDPDAHFQFGLPWGHIPRHAKVYRNYAAERERLQQERINAYKEYIVDVQGRGFPEQCCIVSMEEKKFQRFLDFVEN